MRQKLPIILTLFVVVGVLVLINAANYAADEQRLDSEISPNRSTYHSGPTGTRALYDLLSESGYRVMRWREIPEDLLDDSQPVKTFVIIGDTPLAIEDEQAKSLLLWVQLGGRLVLVDRQASIELPPSGQWGVEFEAGNFPLLTQDPANTQEMTENVKPVSPAQPTLFTHSLDSVMPSRFAAAIRISNIRKSVGQTAEHLAPDYEDSEQDATPTPTPVTIVAPDDSEEDASPMSTPVTIVAPDESTPVSPAPVVHLSDSRGALLVDYPHGLGRIVLLTDPYIFSNGGIGLRDNLQLAINTLASTEGLIAFDEYHQGRGATGNALIGYFAGTPIIPLVGQLILLVLVFLWTRSRRFARALPLEQVDRRSSLEFVASMAELQQRAKAFDLAIENVYSRTRRVLSRYAGVDYNSPRSEIASRVAARSTSVDAHSLEVIMRRCEDAINGEPITEKQSLQLVKRLRDVERDLGLRMRTRDQRQAAQKS